jgi:uncharacterized protein YkwD
VTAAVLPRRPTAAVAAVAALLALLVTFLVPTPARAADAGAEAAFTSALNGERAAAGLPGLAVASDLVAVARRQAARMADSGSLYHNPSLGSEVGGWQKVGENVGRGPGVDVVHQAFMDSPGHRQNILDAAWTEVGVGVEVRDGRIWVAEVFRQPAAAPAPAPEPEPTPAPAPTTAAPAPPPAPAEPAPSAPTADAAPTEPEATAAEEGATAAEPTREPTPAAPADDRALVMLTRIADEDATLDAA